MKTKILNWIYHICRKILATERRPIIIPYRTDKIVLFSHEVVLFDQAVLHCKFNLKEETKENMKKHILQIVKPSIRIEERRAWNDEATIYTALLLANENIKPEDNGNIRFVN